MPVPAFFFVDRPEAYTPRDVTLVPQLWEYGSRRNVDLAPVDFAGSHHLIVASNMNAVSGRRMVTRIAQCGGIGVLTQDLALDELERILRSAKSAHPRFAQPLTVSSEMSVTLARTIIYKMGHRLIVVVDQRNSPIGVVSQTDLDQYKGDSASSVTKVMRTEIESVPEQMNFAEIYDLLYRQRLNAAPVINDEGQVIGVVTRRDCVLFGQSRSGLPAIIRGPSLDKEGRLMVAVAVGINGTALERAKFAVMHGADVIVIDTAHGHQSGMLKTITAVRQALGPSIPIVAGNVCTAEATRAIIQAGADVVKVGVGPGAVCITREETGHGIPQFSAVCECAQEAKQHGKDVWADGGLDTPGQALRVIAAGASRVMMGTALAGTFESKAEVREIGDGLFKLQSGMAGASSVESRNEGEPDRLEAEMRGQYVEGVSEIPRPIRSDTPDVLSLMGRYATGMQSGFAYSGSRTVPELHAKARFRIQTAAGDAEGKPHAILKK